MFKDLRTDIALGIGVVDIKDNEVESAELIAQHIDQAMETLGVDRVRWLHPDCIFWLLPRNVADGKMIALVRGRDLVLGHP